MKSKVEDPAKRVARFVTIKVKPGKEKEPEAAFAPRVAATKHGAGLPRLRAESGPGRPHDLRPVREAQLRDRLAGPPEAGVQPEAAQRARAADRQADPGQGPPPRQSTKQQPVPFSLPWLNVTSVRVRALYAIWASPWQTQ
jgi:hypothetical protein